MNETSSRRGKLILVIGPTGSGKSVLMAHVHEKFPNILFPSTYTTRERRPGNENSSYKFVSVDEFVAMRDAGEFLEWAQFGNNFYGTTHAEIESALAEGKLLIKEMDLQGVRQVQSILSPDELVTIYVDAGSWDELERRVRARAPISDDELQKRKERFMEELPFREEAQFVIPNHPGKLEESKAALDTVLESVFTSAGA